MKAARFLQWLTLSIVSHVKVHRMMKGWNRFHFSTVNISKLRNLYAEVSQLLQCIHTITPFSVFIENTRMEKINFSTVSRNQLIEVVQPKALQLLHYLSLSFYFYHVYLPGTGMTSTLIIGSHGGYRICYN